MPDDEIAVEDRQIRTDGLAERDVYDIVINDVAPEYEAIGTELVARLAAQQLAGWSIEDRALVLEGYWELILHRESESLY